MKAWLNLAVIVALAGGHAATAAGSPAAAAAGRGGGPASAALFLGGLLDPDTAHRLSGELNLDPGSFYVVRHDRGGTPDRIATRDPHFLPPVAMSASGDLIAYCAWREVSCDPAYSLRARFAVVVDTAGEEVAALPGVWDLAWSPAGDRLAVVYGHAARPKGYDPDSIAVMDIRARHGTTFQLQAGNVAWGDSATLVLRSSRTQELNLRTGVVRTVWHRGWIVSPDGKYSLWTEGKAGTPHVVDDAAGLEITSRIRTLLGGKDVGHTIPPFWAARGPSGHVLCVSTVMRRGADAKQTTGVERAARYSVQLVDVAQDKVVRTISGVGLAATTGGHAILIYRDGALHIEDL